MPKKRTIEQSYNCCRYVPGSKIDEGIVSGAAFQLRLNEEYLSANCPNLTDEPTLELQMAELSRVYCDEKAFTPKKSARFGVFGVRLARDYVQSAIGQPIEFEHLPELDDYTHTGIHGIDLDEELIPELLADCVTALFPVVRERD